MLKDRRRQRGDQGGGLGVLREGYATSTSPQCAVSAVCQLNMKRATGLSTDGPPPLEFVGSNYEVLAPAFEAHVPTSEPSPVPVKP